MGIMAPGRRGAVGMGQPEGAVDVHEDDNKIGRGRGGGAAMGVLGRGTGNGSASLGSLGLVALTDPAGGPLAHPWCSLPPNYYHTIPAWRAQPIHHHPPHPNLTKNRWHQLTQQNGSASPKPHSPFRSSGTQILRILFGIRFG